MKIVHFSDPHAGGSAEDWMAYFDKRWVGVFNYRFRRRFRHDLKLLEKAVSYILAVRPDAAVCTGDLTSTGQPGEFERTLAILEPLVKSDIPLIYLPGNHDCYVRRRKCVEAMHHAVSYLNGGEYAFDKLPAVRTIGGLDFLMLNTSRPSNLLCSWGFVSKSDDQWLQDICREAKSRPRILVTHYPMFEDHPVLRVRHRLFGQKNILKLMQQSAIDLALCGHVHKPYCRVDASGRGENCAGSVTRNGVISAIDYDPEKNSFSFESIDLAGWNGHKA
ncbi:MAG: metallophosphoesterase [Lentisphaeria bacterium]|nr:metallophosphoesterase [Lentisphaeria bacterium]